MTARCVGCTQLVNNAKNYVRSHTVRTLSDRRSRDRGSARLCVSRDPDRPSHSACDWRKYGTQLRGGGGRDVDDVCGLILIVLSNYNITILQYKQIFQLLVLFLNSNHL